MENEEKLLQWNIRIKMLFNPILWKNFLVVLGIPILLLGLVFSFTGRFKETSYLAGGLFVFFGFIWFIVGVVIDLSGGFFASYLLTSKGIYFSSGKTEKSIADIAVIAGILTGSSSATGAGLLARAEQTSFIEWGQIKKLKVRRGSRYIFARKGFGSKPVGIYCTKENFEKVLSLIQSKCKG